MDVNCDYLVYGHPSRDSDGAKGTHPCPHCTAGGALDRVEVCEASARAEIPYGEASDGRMVPYLVTFEKRTSGLAAPIGEKQRRCTRERTGSRSRRQSATGWCATAVIQLCWALYCIRCGGERGGASGAAAARSWSHGELQWDHSARKSVGRSLGVRGTRAIVVKRSERRRRAGNRGGGEKRILEGWARSIVSHCVAFQTHGAEIQRKAAAVGGATSR
ncbi:hypothetical protein Q5P01_000670 [Channa striata]|uniref:Uncharacterized protein n=1 Tax=Channa striata TaxID=64152 RepID=A0AA88LMB4_CHASR|nr:hypothetical protein Q5P01_000670 [Channa striata]